MKKKLLALFFITSFLCFGEEIPNNKSIDKSIQMKEEIGLLKNQVTELKTELEEVKRKDDKNQVYLDSLKYYERAKDDAKEIYNKSTEDAKEIFSDSITLILAILGLIGAFLGIVQFRNSKQLEKERKTLEKLKEDTVKKIKELEIEYRKNALELNEKIKDVEFNSKLGIAINKNTREEKIEDLKKIEKEIKNLSIKNKKTLYFQLAYNNPNKEDGIEYYTKIIKLNPNSPLIFANRGLLKKKLDKEDAINDLNEAIKLSPSISKLYSIRGVLKQSLDKEGAINDFDRAIKLDPKNVEAYTRRGLLTQVSDKESALSDFDKAIKLGSKSPEAYIRRGLLTQASDKESALSDFDKAIKLGSKNKNLYYYRGLLKISLDPKSSLDDFNKAIELDSKNPNFYMARGLTINKFDKIGAINDFDKVIELDHQNSNAYYQRAILRTLLFREGTMTDLDKAIELNPKFTIAYNSRIELFLINQNFKLALKDLTKIIELKLENNFNYTMQISKTNYNNFKKYLEDLENKNELQQEGYNRLLAKAEGGFTIIEE